MDIISHTFLMIMDNGYNLMMRASDNLIQLILVQKLLVEVLDGEKITKMLIYLFMRKLKNLKLN
jgi:hypothetical protein